MKATQILTSKTEELYVYTIHVFKQPCMQAEYHANVYTLVTVSNDKQNIQHRSTTSSLVQVMHVHLLFSDTYN